MIPARKDVFGGTLEFCGQVMPSQRALEKFGLSATGLIIVQYNSPRSHERLTSRALPIQVQMCCNMIHHRSESDYLVLFLLLSNLFSLSDAFCRTLSVLEDAVEAGALAVLRFLTPQ